MFNFYTYIVGTIRLISIYSSLVQNTFNMGQTRYVNSFSVN